MAVNSATIWTTTLAVFLCLIVLTEQVPVDLYNREKDFLDAFGDWLRRAQAAKNIDERADPGMSYLNQEGPNSIQQGNDHGIDLALPQASKAAFDGEWIVDHRWPKSQIQLGQVGGVSSDEKGNAVVFHRADRKWEQSTFDKNNTYTEAVDGAITEPTVLTLNRSNGAVVDSWGENLFYLPHGLTVDSEGNYWVTDVALHQVFKFSKDKKSPELTLGKAFEPAADNDDMERFCKPTDVAVASNGDFFVSDGYCNSRIIKYSRDGQVIAAFGKGDSWVPHSLALAEDLDLICLADRENKRIICYKAGIHDEESLGAPDRGYLDPDVMGRVFAIAYGETDGYLYAVTAPTDDLPGYGFTIDLEAENADNDIISVWSPHDNGFDMPHDIDITRDGESIYVGEIGPNKIWKFFRDE